MNEFIATYYGKELIAFLKNDFDPGSLDDRQLEMNPVVKEQLLKVPRSWYNDYVLYETAGLNCKMKNEPELRLMNITLFLLKLAQQGDQLR